jgi:hypothetical protein
VNFAFQTDKPTGRDLVGLTAMLLSISETAFFNLSQRELPSLPYCTETFADSYGHGLFLPETHIFTYVSIEITI